MKVYFCGSIAGGAQDVVEWYLPIIAHVEQRHSVFTADIFRHPDVVANGGEKLDPKFIFNRDIREGVPNCKAMIAEVTAASHGVGYEIALGERFRKPMLLLHRPAAGRRLSPILSGNPYKRMVVRPYDSLVESFKHIDGFLEDVAAKRI